MALAQYEGRYHESKEDNEVTVQAQDEAKIEGQDTGKAKGEDAGETESPREGHTPRQTRTDRISN